VDASFDEIEAVLFVLSARERIGAGDRFIASKVFALGVPVVIVLNKVDRLKPAHIAEQMSSAARLAAGPKALAAGARFRADHPEADWVDNFRALHPVSAKTGDGIAALRDELVGLLPEGPLYFPTEQRSDLSVEMQIAELIREKALWLTRDEVPHAISVEVESIEEKSVTASILVETESQKLIMVGKGGAMIKDVGTRARPEIEELLRGPVFLELRVKVRPKWRRDAATLERLGL
jgi:GTP-binding protein Era